MAVVPLEFLGLICLGSIAVSRLGGSIRLVVLESKVSSLWLLITAGDFKKGICFSAVLIQCEELMTPLKRISEIKETSTYT